MSKSVRSVEMVQGEASAEATLERIIADYVQKMNQNNATALRPHQNDIDNKSVYGDNVTATYVIFDSNGNEAPDTAGLNRTLKVTVAARGTILVTLLTRSRNANSTFGSILIMHNKPTSGFVLIELVTTLILIGVLGAFAGLFLYNGING